MAPVGALVGLVEEDTKLALGECGEAGLRLSE
jgi:hypothetical protein